jgi:peroxiredoxin
MFRKLIARFLPGGGTSLKFSPGDAAPQFQCLDQDWMLVRSDELIGTRYVMWFYPKADTGG